MYDPDALRHPSIASRLFLLVLLLALPACGVRFRDTFEGTEVFKSIKLTGERQVDAALTVTVGLTQGYPLAVHVACYYESEDELSDDQKLLAFDERAKRVYETVLAPASKGKPNDKHLVRDTLTFSFSVPVPGDYFVSCETPAAPENGLGLNFTIADKTSASAGLSR